MSNLNGAVQSTKRKLRFEECCKNHLYSHKGFKEDGCKKFTANRMEGVSQLLCDACDCHKSFHKRKLVKDRSADAKVVWYGKCQKKHRIHENLFHTYLDGCCQFIASKGERGSRDVLICDGCGCHRNFHQMEEDEKEEEKPTVAAAQPRREWASDDGTMYDSEEYYDD